jgi:hypothetical protein
MDHAAVFALGAAAYNLTSLSLLVPQASIFLIFSSFLRASLPFSHHFYVHRSNNSTKSWLFFSRMLMMNPTVKVSYNAASFYRKKADKKAFVGGYCSFVCCFRAHRVGFGMLLFSVVFVHSTMYLYPKPKPYTYDHHHCLF